MTTSPKLAPIEVRILVLLTFTAGIYDATTFLALDRVFVAIVTGNIILIGVSLASSEMTLAGPIVALIAFVVGAGITGRLDSAGADRWLLLRRTVVVESALLVPAIALAISYDGQEIRRLLILALLAGAMGCRNATIRAGRGAGAADDRADDDARDPRLRGGAGRRDAGRGQVAAGRASRRSSPGRSPAASSPSRHRSLSCSRCCSRSTSAPPWCSPAGAPQPRRFDGASSDRAESASGEGFEPNTRRAARRRAGMATEERVTYCRICEPLCGMVATVTDGEVTKLRPDPDHPLSKGFACPKGIAMTEIQNDPDRVTHPLRRKPDGSFERVSWKLALDEIGERLGRIKDAHGGGSIGWYMGNPGAFSYSHPLWVKGFIDGLGSQHYYTASSQDVSNRFAASSLLYGSPFVLPIPDLARCEMLFMLGANPLVSHGSVMSAPRVKDQLHAITKRGGRVIVVDPRRTETAREFEHVAVNPDSDAWLLLSLLNVIFEESLQDTGTLPFETRGIERLRGDGRGLPARGDRGPDRRPRRRCPRDRPRHRRQRRLRDLRPHRLLSRPQRHARLVPARRAGARHRQPRQRGRLAVRRSGDPVRPRRRADRRRQLRQGALARRRLPRGARGAARLADGEGDHLARARAR